MFIHQHSLRHLLRPEHYCSESHFQLELEKLFRPAWQFVAAKSELPKDGDFLTVELFGRPVLIRNSSGRFLAFENICSHRHCLLTDAECGHQPVLRCQYHGWEFDCESNWKVPAENTLESYHVLAGNSIETLRFLVIKATSAGLFGFFVTPVIAVVALADATSQYRNC